MLTYNPDTSNSASLMQKQRARNASLLSKHRSDSISSSCDLNDDSFANGEKFELQSELFLIFSHLVFLSQLSSDLSTTENQSHIAPRASCSPLMTALRPLA